jgi:hypothetical protein
MAFRSSAAEVRDTVQQDADMADLLAPQNQYDAKIIANRIQLEATQRGLDLQNLRVHVGPMVSDRRIPGRLVNVVTFEFTAIARGMLPLRRHLEGRLAVTVTGASMDWPEKP